MSDAIRRSDIAKEIDPLDKAAGAIDREIREEKSVDADDIERISILLETIGIDRPEDITPRKSFAKWLAKNLSLRDLVFSPQASRSLEDRVNGPVEGSGPQLALRVRELSKEKLGKRDGAGAWRHFMKHNLAATLARERKRGASVESQVDILVQSLLPTRSGLWGETLYLLVRAAHVNLEGERRRATPGYYKTRGALADLLGASASEAGWRLRAFLYDKILRELNELGASQPDWKLGGDWRGIVEADANNLAATLSELGEESSFGAQRLSTVAGVGKVDPSGIDAAFHVVDPIWQAFAVKPVQSLAVLLPVEMMNVPTAWRALVNDPANASVARSRTTRPAASVRKGPISSGALNGHVLVACLGALAGALRAALGASDKDVTTAFFNSGVNLDRAEDAGASLVNGAAPRVALNGAGLAWALRNVREDHAAATDALHVANGLDCAVNLMGAVTELTGRKPDKQRIATFAAALWRYRAGPKSEEYVRLEGSLKEIGVPVPDAAEIDSAPLLQETLSELLNAVLSSTGIGAMLSGNRLPDGPDGGAMLAGATAPVLRASIGGLYDAYAKRISESLDELALQAGDSRALLQHYCDSTSLSWSADEEAKLDETRKSRKTLDQVLRDVADDLLG